MRLNGIVAASGKFTAIAPSVTINAVTNFNQDRATFNATVNPNGATTSVQFQYSTNGSSWTNGSTISGLTGGSQSVYSNQTSLSVGTLYYVRAVGTNSAGSTTSGNASFTTWSLQTFDKTSGTHTFYIPTITPTGGSAITPYIYYVMMFGGGGGGSDGGGGGGSYYQVSSLTVGGNGGVYVEVGGGGLNTGAGGTSYLHGWNGGSLSTGNLTVAGGGGGSFSAGGRTGYSGNGNPGGINSYTSGKNFVHYGSGGGGGANGWGNDGFSNEYAGYGGNGGAAITLSQGGVSRTGGAGGGGTGSHGWGSTPSSSYGTGGSGYNVYGGAGMVYFRYYAASALA